MFNEREMSKAIDWLFELFSPEDYEGYDEDEIGYAGGLYRIEGCGTDGMSVFRSRWL